MNDYAGGRRSPLGLFPRQPTPRLYDRVLEMLGTRHYSNIQAGAFCRDYSRRTEEAYIHWIRRFILFHSGAHPRELAESDINRFLTPLAVKENVAASTQNQALAALLFLYEHVLGQALNRIEGVVRPQAEAAAGRVDARGGPGSPDPLGWCLTLGLHAPSNDSIIQ